MALIARWASRGARLVTTVAIVDSGSSLSLFPVELALELGLEERDLTPSPHGAQGVEGLFETWSASEPIWGRVLSGRTSGRELWGQEFALRPLFSEHEVALLGRWDFFRAFVITFEEDERAPRFHLDSHARRAA